MSAPRPASPGSHPAAADGGASEPSATRRLAAFAAGIEAAELPPPVVAAAGRLLLDTVGCMLGGGATAVGRTIAAWARDGAGGGTGGGTATVVGVGARTSPLLAAYANGRLAALLDADETYPGARQTSHLAAAVVGAALAAGEARAVPGGTLAAAIVAGYEVGARVSNAMVPPAGGGRAGLRAGWGPGSVLAATAAAGRVLELGPGAMAHAFGLAGLHVDPPPLKWTEVRPAPAAKSADAGWHALTALVAAEHAALGLTGYDTILDGDTGLWRALGYEAGDEAALTDGFGERWIVLDAAFKRWPCQYWMHPALTALQGLLERERPAPAAIDAIVLATNPRSMAAKFHDPEPPGEIDRAFSFPHAAAMLALEVPPGPRWFEDGLDADPAVRRLRRVVRVEAHPEAVDLDRWATDHQLRDLPAAATLVAGGRTLRAEARFGHGAPWSGESRLDDAALATKFREMALPARPGDATWTSRVEAAIPACLHVTATPDVGALARLVGPPATEIP